MSHSYSTFETPIGVCALVWTADAVAGSFLPENESEALLSRIKRRFPNAAPGQPPGFAATAIAAINNLLCGLPSNLSQVPLDLANVSADHRRIYAAARAIPPGETRTYGALAALAGDGIDARAVGRAMAENRFPIIVPCHRVMGANGQVGGFSAPGGTQTKIRMLNIERGAAPKAQTGLFDDLPLAIRPRIS